MDMVDLLLFVIGNEGYRVAGAKQAGEGKSKKWLKNAVYLE